MIARACLSQVIRNEALLRRSADPELVHQMRVGFRRLNAAVSLFEPMLRDRDSKAVRAEIRWAGKKLGLVRDLDVLIARLRKVDHLGKGPQVLEEAERLRAENAELRAQLEEWERAGQFVFWWGRDYHMSSEGEVLST